MDRAQAGEKLAMQWDRKKCSSPPHSSTRLGVGPGERRHMLHRSQNGTGRNAEPKEPVSPAWGKIDWLGSGPTLSMWKFGKLLDHSEKASALPHTQTDIIPGEQRSLPCELWRVLTRCTSLFSPWASWREPLSLLLIWWCSHPCVHMFSCPGACHMAMAMWAPHVGSRREAEVVSQQEQSYLLGWGLQPLTSCPQVLKDCTLKWSRNSGHWLCLGLAEESWTLSMAERGDGLWDRSPPFSQVVLHLKKTKRTLFFAPTSASWVWLLWSRQPNLLFCSVTVKGEEKVINYVFRSSGELQGLFLCPSEWSHGKVRELFHPRAVELKHNLGQDVTFSLSQVWTLWPWTRSQLSSSAASGVADHFGGKVISVKDVERERGMISRARI